MDRLNISLDTLRPERFTQITRMGTLEQAMEGLAAAQQAGFTNLKINTVLIGGFNDDDDFGFLSVSQSSIPGRWRFIELMPMGPCANWDKRCFPARHCRSQALPGTAACSGTRCGPTISHSRGQRCRGPDLPDESRLLC